MVVVTDSPRRNGDPIQLRADKPESLDVPLAWVGFDETPIIFANQFLIQSSRIRGFVIGVGQATPPPLIGTPEQMREQVEQIESYLFEP